MFRPERQTAFGALVASLVTGAGVFGAFGPGRRTRRATSATTGAAVFNYLGRAGCHVTTTFTVTANSRSVSFQPFSDFLMHDMGTLGDGIGNDGDRVNVTRRMRTAPLWGPFLSSL